MEIARLRAQQERAKDKQAEKVRTYVIIFHSVHLIYTKAYVPTYVLLYYILYIIILCTEYVATYICMCVYCVMLVSYIGLPQGQEEPGRG